MNYKTNEKLHKFAINLQKDEKIVEFFFEDEIFNIKSNFLQFYCITNQGKIYFIKKGLTLLDVTEIIDCGTGLKVFCEDKTIVLYCKSYIYIINENFHKIIQLNLLNFIEIESENDSNIFTFLVGTNEIWVFYNEKILVLETEYYEVSQM